MFAGKNVVSYILVSKKEVQNHEEKSHRIITQGSDCQLMTKLIEYEEASEEVRAVYDDIRATRQNDYINNFWKAIANHPPPYNELGKR